MIYLLLGGVVLLAILLQLVYPQTFFLQPAGLDRHLAMEFVSDLGGLIGFGGFFLLLSLLGLVMTWKKKRVYYLGYLLVIFLIVAFVFLNAYSNIYLNFILAILAGQGLIWLWKRPWKFNFIKKFSILILVLGIIFSTVSYINRLAVELPDEEIKESLVWLKNKTKPGEIIFSHPGKSFWIEYFAERPAYFDFFSPDPQIQFNQTQAIFYSRDIKTTVAWMEENKISYVWIDRTMRQGQVWSEKDEGLLFLLSDQRFQRRYKENEIEIWKFVEPR